MGAVGFEVVLIAILVSINAVLSGSELAVISARKHRLQQRADNGDEGAQAALALQAEPNRFLSTTQIGITLVGILAGVFGGATVAEKLAMQFEDAGLSEGVAGALSVATVVIVITYLSLVIGELVPKRIALAHPETIASKVSRPMKFLALIGGPLVSLLSFSTDSILRVLRVKGGGDSAISEDEIRMLLLESTRAGVFEPVEQEIATAALRLADRHVVDVMTPRMDVVWLDLNDDAAELLKVAADAPHLWFPVVDGGSDSVAGAISVKDLFRSFVAGDRPDIRRSLKAVTFMPESVSLAVALGTLRDSEAPLAVVVDEYGGTSGIVTLTDVLESVIGDLPAAPGETADIIERADGAWDIDGRLPLDRLWETLELRGEPPEGDFQTLAGLILHHLGRIPVAGDRVALGELQLEVTLMDARRVERVLVRCQ